MPVPRDYASSKPGEEVADLESCGVVRVGAVSAVVLDALAEFLANGAVCGFGGVGGAHGVAPLGDRAFGFQNDDNGFASV